MYLLKSPPPCYTHHCLQQQGLVFPFTGVGDQTYEVLCKQQRLAIVSAPRPEPRPLVHNTSPPRSAAAEAPHSLFSPAPFLCSRSRRRCRYPVLCNLFILAPRKMTMLLGTSLVVTQPCHNTRHFNLIQGTTLLTFPTFKSIWCFLPAPLKLTFKPQHQQLSVKMSPYHDGVGEVAISLALQPHGAELSSHVAIRGGFVKGGLPDTSHFRGHKEGQHALESRNNIKMSTTWMRG